MKRKSLKLTLALQIISAVSAFLFGFFYCKYSDKKEGVPLALFLLNYYLGGFVGNFITIFIHNYAVAFILYALNYFTFGVLGIINLFFIFYTIGFSSFFAKNLFYWLFIIFESIGFLYSVFISTNIRFKTKLKNFNLCKQDISKSLMYIAFILFISSFLETLSIKQ